MKKIDWTKVTYEDILEAIEIFNRDNPEYPEPRVTFLIHNKQKLPAKHIRGMAYKVAYGKEVKKSDFGGGMETVKFFERLGFEVDYRGKSIRERKDNVVERQEINNEENKIEAAKKIKGQAKDGLKIGLYLQTDELKNENDFNKAIEKVKNSEIDIFVLPEFSYFPFVSMVEESDLANKEDVDKIYEASLDLSQEIGKAIIISSVDKFGTIFSLYANAFADEEETGAALYIKHTMTSYSAFDFDKYDELAKDMFEPILYKGYKIGMTICYDCNHSLFSRVYGLQNIDLIINSTGGNVVYDKWYKYNKARAIENSCFNFVTMGGNGLIKNPKAYVYGFNPNGKELVAINGNKENPQNNYPGSIYIYDTALDDGGSSRDLSINQKKSINKNYHLKFPLGKSSKVLKKAKKLTDFLYVQEIESLNIIYALVEGDDILKAEKVLPLLYSKKLRGLNNKRYIIINRYATIDKEFFENKLSLILKVRSMENFCGVILESKNINNCYQSGKNRTAQVIEAIDGEYRIDLSRTTGPEAIWKNKDGMRASWRNNFEWLVDKISKEGVRNCSNQI